jgi:hypothetical protein
MRRSLFLRIVENVTYKNPYFVQKRDACHHLSFSPLQKCTIAMKILAYGGSAISLMMLSGWVRTQFLSA